MRSLSCAPDGSCSAAPDADLPGACRQVRRRVRGAVQLVPWHKTRPAGRRRRLLCHRGRVRDPREIGPSRPRGRRRSVRPAREHRTRRWRRRQAEQEHNVLPGVVLDVAPLGADVHVVVQLAGKGRLLAIRKKSERPRALRRGNGCMPSFPHRMSLCSRRRGDMSAALDTGKSGERSDLCSSRRRPTGWPARWRIRTPSKAPCRATPSKESGSIRSCRPRRRIRRPSSRRRSALRRTASIC